MKRIQKTGFLFVAILFTCVLFYFNANQSKAAGSYWVKINKQKCVVTIYQQNSAGKYKPLKAMICSPGKATPIGSFNLKEKMRWHTLDGPCYGQYCSRINKGVLFHSVWYYKQLPNTLANFQYNNLGKMVSHGCIRLCVRDAKWIYDNIPSGTKVTIYNSKNPGPLGKPVSIKVPGYMGWDPTDETNSDNPWNSKKPSIRGAKNKNIVFASKYKVTTGIKVKNTTGYNASKLLKIKIKYFGSGADKYVTVKKVDTKKVGIYKITYSITDEINRKAQVTVKHKVLTKVSVSKITLNQYKKTLYLGGKSSQKYTTVKALKVLPTKASIKKLKITLSDKSVATISKSGKVTAKKAGTCKVTFMATDGSAVKATCVIIVKQKASSISLSASNTEVAVGKTLSLVATVLPTDTTAKNVNYTSSNSSIATVDANGVVVGVQAGRVVITAKTLDGTNRLAKVTLTIVNQFAQVDVSTLTDLNQVVGDDISVALAKLPAQVKILDITGHPGFANVTWSSVDYNGQVAGTYHIVGTVVLPGGWRGTVEPISINVKVEEVVS